MFAPPLLLLALLSGPALAEEETLYLADSMEVGDGLTTLFQVDLDGGEAHLTELALIAYEQGDAIAADASGTRIWVMDKAESGQGFGNFGFYDFKTKFFVDLGELLDESGSTLPGVVLATTSPDDVLYVASIVTDTLYTVDPTTAKASPVGQFIDEDTGEVVNINGGDLAFDSEGVLYLATNGNWVDSQMGIWEVDAETGMSSFVGDFVTQTAWYTGLALRHSGEGSLVSSTTASTVVELDTFTGQVLETFPMVLDGQPYQYSFGDMTVGAIRAIEDCEEDDDSDEWEDDDSSEETEDSDEWEDDDSSEETEDSDEWEDDDSSEETDDSDEWEDDDSSEETNEEEDSRSWWSWWCWW